MNTDILKYVVVPVILFFVTLLMVFWVLMPLYGYIETALDVKSQNEAILVQRKNLATNLNRLIKQYNDRSADNVSFAKAIPAGQNLPELLVNLEAMASENNMTFSGVDFKQKDFKKEGIKTLILNLRLKGSYLAFQNYLKAAEQSLRIFDVANVSFNGAGGSGQAGVKTSGDLDFNLTINTYFQ